MPGTKHTNVLDVPSNVQIGILNFLSREQDAYVSRELIEEGLNAKGIKYKVDLSDILNNMAAKKLLDHREAKTSQERLYRMSETGKALLEKEKS